MDSSQITALLAELVQNQLPYLITQVTWIFATITMMGWTMTLILIYTRNLQKEQVEALDVISTDLRRTANDTLTALKSTVATTERSTAILETQARQLDVLLRKMGVKEGKRPWLPCNAGISRHGPTGRSGGRQGTTQGQCAVHGQGPPDQGPGGPPPPPLRIALGLDRDTSEIGGRRSGGTAGEDSNAADAQGR